MHNSLRLPHSFLSFAREHDDLPAFNAAYWILTFLAAMLFNAGAFAVLIAGHMVLDICKYREVHTKKWSKVFEGVIRESLLDVSLLSLGIAFGVYCHSSLPIIAGLRGVIRTEIEIINAIIQVSVKAHVLHGTLTILANLHQYLESVHPRLGKPSSLLELVSIVGLVASLVMIVLSPWLLDLSQEDIAHIAADMLIPWKL